MRLHATATPAVVSQLSTASAFAAIVLSLALAGCSGSANGPGGEAGLAAKHLYMGVACGTGNEVGCDRVAISVQVPSRPDFVVAIVAGHRIRMVDIADREHHRGPFVYQGAIEPEGLLAHGPLAVDAEPSGYWSGSPAVRVPVIIQAVYRHQGIRERQFDDVRLMPGFG